MKSPPLLILGSTTLDINIIRGKPNKKIGGVPVYAGLTWKKLGADPVIISNISGSDQYIHRFFHDQGIRLKSGVTEKTTSFINEYDEDRRNQRMLCAASPVQSEQLTAIWKDIHQIHLGPLHPMDLFPDVYSLDPDSRLITLDIQGLTRSIDNDKIVAKTSPFIMNALKMTHMIKADDNELDLMLKYMNMSVHEIMAFYQLKEIVETKAGNGGNVYTLDDVYAFQAHPKKQIIDTTGAGDVFFAAYLFSRIHKKRNIQESCNDAAAIAAHHIEGQWITTDVLSVKA